MTTTIPTNDFVLPDGFIPASPDGKPAPVPTRFTDTFRPAFPNDPATHKMLDQFFANTRKAEQASNDHQASFPDSPLPVAKRKTHTTTADGLMRVSEDGTITYLYLMDNGDGTFTATKSDSDEALCDAKGKPILCDMEGHPLPPKKRWWDKIAEKIGDPSGGDDEADVIVYDKHGTPIGDFDVVSVGHAPTSGRGRRGSKALMVGAASLAAFSCASLLLGVIVGRTAVPAQGQVTEEEAAKYHLSSFPTDSAATFGRHYVELCLTHPDKEEAQNKRVELMKGMALQQLGEGCGWTSGGQKENPVTINFNGEVENRTEYQGGQVAYLGYFVSMSSGDFMNVTLPVWAGENTDGRKAFKVVGQLGYSAAPAQDAVPNLETGLMEDRQIAPKLKPMLETFFKAWGQSDRKTLEALTATDAKGDVLSGMSGKFQKPEITSVRVIPFDPPVEVQGQTATFEYVEGSQVTALVNLDWTVKDDSGGRTQPAGYRVTMTLINNKWQVSEMLPGLVAEATATAGEGQGGAAGAGDGIGTVNDLK